MEDLKPQQKLGQYTVLRKLAEGGMAEIYLATRGGASGFSKSCVLKRVRAEHRADEKFREMFELEAKLAANLEHSNIVQIFDFQSSDDGELFLAMQYVDGGSLETLRRDLPRRVVPPFLVARIGRDVASALAYAFTVPGPDGKPLGLVHRDISPHNILVSRQGEVKLTDFGIAKPASTHTTGLNIKGKIAYMAPEQARGQPVDARTDIFSLGVVLFELATGSRPLVGNNDLAEYHELTSGSRKAPRASTIGTPVPEALEDVLERALQRQPEHRYQSADEMARALEQVLRTAPSDVDTDLARFVGERMGPAVAVTPTAVPQLQTGAFDATQISQGGKVREPTAMMSSDAVQIASAADHTLIRGVDKPPTPMAMPAISRSQAAPQAPVSPLPALPEPVDATSRAVPAFEEPPPDPERRPPEPDTAPRSSPEVAAAPDVPDSEDAPAPLFTSSMKRALGLAVPLVVLLGAFGAYRATRQSSAPEQTVVKVSPPVPEPKPVEAKPVEPKPIEAPKVEPKVEPPPAPVPEAKVDPKPEAPVEASPHTVHHAIARAAGKTGTLVLSCTPYAEVYEGATKISDDGMAPVVLPAGTHHLRFKYDSRWASLRVEIPPDGRACAGVNFTGQVPAATTRCGSR